jgi:hypothetical protein
MLTHTIDYFRDEIARFWEAMSDVKLTVRQIDLAAKAITHLYVSRFNARTPEEANQARVAWNAAMSQWNRRRLYREARERLLQSAA